MESYFFKIANQIKENLHKAEKSIDIAVSWFTRKDIFEILIQKLKSKVTINLIIVNDDLNINSKGLNFQNFIDNGGSLFLCDPYNLMHNKYCVIDKKVVLSGSYNWTYFAETRNFENLIVLDKIELAKKYILNFESIKEFAPRAKKMVDVKPIKNSFLSRSIVEEEQISSTSTVKKTLNPINSRINKIRTQPKNKYFFQYVTALDISPDGTLLASSGGEWSVKFWNIKKEELSFEFDLKEKNFRSYPSYVRFAPHGNQLCTYDGFEGLYIFDIYRKQLLYKKEFQGSIHSIAYSQNGERIAVGSGCKLFIITAKTGSIIETVTTPFKFTIALEFMENGNSLLVGSNLSPYLTIYSLQKGEYLFNYSSKVGSIKKIRKIDENTFLVCGFNNKIYLCNLKEPNPLLAFIGHENYCFDCDVSEDGKYVVSASLDKTIKLWNLKTGELLKTFKGHKKGVYAVKFNPKSNEIFSSGEDGQILKHSYRMESDSQKFPAIEE